MQRVILASSSNQRKMLMQALGIPFEIIPANIDEGSIRSDDMELQAESIARAKAEKVASQHDGIVIAGDAFVTCNGELFEKPSSLDEARSMLSTMSGNWITEYCGVCYIDRKNNIDYATSTVSKAKFRELSEKEIEEYVSQFPVTTWAAAFSSAYIYGMTMVAELQGSFTGFIHGFPMEVVVPLLRKSGLEVSFKNSL